MWKPLKKHTAVWFPAINQLFYNKYLLAKKNNEVSNPIIHESMYFQIHVMEIVVQKIATQRTVAFNVFSS